MCLCFLSLIHYNVRALESSALTIAQQQQNNEWEEKKRTMRTKMNDKMFSVWIESMKTTEVKTNGHWLNGPRQIKKQWKKMAITQRNEEIIMRTHKKQAQKIICFCAYNATVWLNDELPNINTQKKHTHFDIFGKNEMQRWNKNYVVIDVKNLSVAWIKRHTHNNKKRTAIRICFFSLLNRGSHQFRTWFSII